MNREEILKKLNSAILCLMAHPDNEPNSEFADRIDDLIDIRDSLSNTKEKEEMECFVSVPWCEKCDPVQAGRTMAPTAKGKYKCNCGHTYETPTPIQEQKEEKECPCCRLGGFVHPSCECCEGTGYTKD